MPQTPRRAKSTPYIEADSPSAESDVITGGRRERSSSETFRNSPKVSTPKSRKKNDTRANKPAYDNKALFKATIVGLLLIFGIFYFTNDIVIDGQKGLIPRFSISLGLVFIPTLFYLKPVSTRRTAAAFLYFELCTLLMNISSSIAWYRNPRELGTLPDLGHDMIGTGDNPPEYYRIFGFDVASEGICDNLILTLAVMTVVFAAYQPNGSDIWRRFVMVYGTLNLMRTFTVLLTSLPDASPACRELTPIGDLPNGAWTFKAMNSGPIMWEIFIHTLMITIPVHPVTCGDMIFSGHSNSALCLALVW